MSLGTKIRDVRKEQGLSQGALGKIAGIHEKLLSKYEHERIIPTADTLRKIALALHVSADYLIFENVPKEGKVELKDLELFSMFKELEKIGEEERETVKRVIDAMIVKSKVERAVRPEPWGERAKMVLSKTRERAKGYSEAEIEKITDEAVQAVRREEKRKKAA